MDHEIHLECLPPYSITILQPLDVLTLSKVKTSCRRLQNHYKETNNQPITKQKFVFLVKFYDIALRRLYLIFLDVELIQEPFVARSLFWWI